MRERRCSRGAGATAVLLRSACSSALPVPLSSPVRHRSPVLVPFLHHAVQVERTSPPMDEGRELLFQRSDGEHAAVVGLSGAVEIDNRRTRDIHGQEHYGASRSVLQAVLRESGPELRAGGGGSGSGPCCPCCTRESPPTCR
ncbi:uncharacterized protein ACNS7B_003374 [Menidia menidia]